MLWNDGSKNVVCINELKNVKDSEPIKLGSKVKMLFKKKWYEGKVMDTEWAESDSSEEISLAEVSRSLRVQMNYTDGSPAEGESCKATDSVKINTDSLKETQLAEPTNTLELQPQLSFPIGEPEGNSYTIISFFA